MEQFYTRNLTDVENAIAQRAVEGRTRMERVATVRPEKVKPAEDGAARAAA